MCGRTRLLIPFSELAKLLRCELDEWPDGVWNEIRPTESIPVIRLDDHGKRHLSAMRWGLIPSWAADKKMGGKLFNARVETAAEKPAFRSAWKKRRCLVIADAFYEWSGPKGSRTPNVVERRDKAPIAMAGLWECWIDKSTGEVVDSCTILTRESDGPIKAVHDRMPVILSEDAQNDWLVDRAADPASVMTCSLTEGLTIMPIEKIA